MRRHLIPGSLAIVGVAMMPSSLRRSKGRTPAQRAGAVVFDWRTWDKGPEGYLLTRTRPRSGRRSHRGRAKRFIDLFWARRNPNPDLPFNSFRRRSTRSSAMLTTTSRTRARGA